MSSRCQHLFGGLWSWRLAARLYAKGRTQLLPCPAVGGPWSCTGGLWGQRLRLPASTPLNITSANKELISCTSVSGQLSDGIILITAGVGQIQDLY